MKPVGHPFRYRQHTARRRGRLAALLTHLPDHRALEDIHQFVERVLPTDHTKIRLMHTLRKEHAPGRHGHHKGLGNLHFLRHCPIRQPAQARRAKTSANLKAIVSKPFP